MKGLFIYANCNSEELQHVKLEIAKERDKLDTGHLATHFYRRVYYILFTYT